jgi:hypothetical protein
VRRLDDFEALLADVDANAARDADREPELV